MFDESHDTYNSDQAREPDDMSKKTSKKDDKKKKGKKKKGKKKK